MPRKPKSIAAGQKYGDLTVVGFSHYNKHGQAMYDCSCECGNSYEAYGYSLTTGAIKACPHVRPRHGMCATPEYQAFKEAKKRCNTPSATGFRYYGGRGIKFLFTSFQQFFAEIGPKPTPRHSLNRIDNDGNYEPGNVEWATPEVQRANCRRPRSYRTFRGSRAYQHTL